MPDQADADEVVRVRTAGGGHGNFETNCTGHPQFASQSDGEELGNFNKKTGGAAVTVFAEHVDLKSKPCSRTAASFLPPRAV